MDREKLILSKLKFKYDKTDVLSIDHLELATGVITVFMGSNGSGKTTLLKLLSGLLKPEEGTVGFSSEVLRKRAVMVHQVPYLFAGSVKYNINFALSGNKTGSKKREKIIRTVLDQADLLHLINRKSSTLSGGEKHRLALARAIAVDPEILILDEPFAHIDTRSHLLIEKIIGNRATTGK
ncbi:MAG: ATP-binding cassette domain-containing protein, partial [Spirochaetales bacterium]|nr:ATP-binding cassette domain-containing protein [Spirochaetales bacterium]